MNTVRKVIEFLCPSTIVAGALGGISPYLVTLAKSLLDATPHTNIHFSDLINPEYLTGLILIALIGGAVARLFQEIDLKKAFVLGIGAPALIAATYNSAESPKNTPTARPSQSMAFPSLITTGHAEVPTVANPSSPASEPFVLISVQSPVPVIAHFLDAKFNTVLSVLLQNTSKDVSLTIPQSAESIQFQAGDNYSTPISDPQGHRFTVNVTKELNFGFNQPFFNRPPSINYHLNVAVKNLPI